MTTMSEDAATKIVAIDDEEGLRDLLHVASAWTDLWCAALPTGSPDSN